MLEGVVFIGTLKLKNPFGGLVVSVTTKPPSGLLYGIPVNKIIFRNPAFQKKGVKPGTVVLQITCKLKK